MLSRSCTACRYYQTMERSDTYDMYIPEVPPSNAASPPFPAAPLEPGPPPANRAAKGSLPPPGKDKPDPPPIPPSKAASGSPPGRPPLPVAGARGGARVGTLLGTLVIPLWLGLLVGPLDVLTPAVNYRIMSLHYPRMFKIILNVNEFL